MNFDFAHKNHLMIAVKQRIYSKVVVKNNTKSCVVKSKQNIIL